MDGDSLGESVVGSLGFGVVIVGVGPGVDSVSKVVVVEGFSVGPVFGTSTTAKLEMTL